MRGVVRFRLEALVTYTVLLTDAAAGVVGIASVTAGLSVGNSVPAIDPASGAVASQAWTNRALRHAALAALRAGLSPGDAVAAALQGDPGPDHRQLGVVDFEGRSAVHTGRSCTPWAGAREGLGFVVLGNYLAGPEVLDQAAAVMAEPADETAAATSREPTSAEPDESGLVTPPDPVAVIGASLRLLRALRAAESAGGDLRGAGSACLFVARRSRDVELPPLLDIDLRIDQGDDPVADLDRLLTSRLAQGGVPVAPTRAASFAVRPRTG